MKNIHTNYFRIIFIFGFFLLAGQHTLFAQDSFSSIKINIQNLVMSWDAKTISYDVYIQDVDSENPIAIPAFLIRMKVPQSELGTNAKTVTVTHESSALGAMGASMTQSGSDWLMFFTQANLITSYGTALMLSEDFPGTRIGTFNISNTDGSAFANPQSFTATFAGTAPQTKSTVSIFNENTTTLAANATAPLPETSFFGFGTKSVPASKIQLTVSGTKANSKPYDGTTTATVTLGTISGILSDDIGNVAISATAVYDNANAGTGKSITVSYSLTGSATDKYLAPADTTLSNGVITKCLTVKAYFEGLWNKSAKTLNKCKEWDNDLQDLVDKYTGDVADHVTIELHSATYSNIAYTFNNLPLHQDGTITSDGLSSIGLPDSITGSFYLTIKNRNHLETTSAALVSFDVNTISYDFTDDASKAFVSDIEVTPCKQIDGKWMIYTGNVVTDTDYPEINMSDLYELFNNRSSITDVYGYSTLDLNGDGFIDEADLYALFANKNIYMYKE